MRERGMGEVTIGLWGLKPQKFYDYNRIFRLAPPPSLILIRNCTLRLQCKSKLTGTVCANVTYYHCTSMYGTRIRTPYTYQYVQIPILVL